MSGAAPPESVRTPEELLVELSALYRIQPATALWRAVEIAEVLAEGLPDGTGLDLGCGDGALTGLILRHLSAKPKLIGLDYDAGEIAVAQRRGVYERTVCSGGEAMKVESASVDFIFSNSVLEHLTDLDATIAESARVLRPGGAFIATVPQPNFRNLLAGSLLPWRNHESYLTAIDARLAHLNYLDVAAWRELLARHGMELVSHREYLDRRQVRRWERFSNLTAGVLQMLGASNALLYRLQRWTRADNPSAGGLLGDAPRTWRHRLWAKLVAGGALMPVPEAGAHGYGCLLIRARKKNDPA